MYTVKGIEYPEKKEVKMKFIGVIEYFADEKKENEYREFESTNIVDVFAECDRIFDGMKMFRIRVAERVSVWYSWDTDMERERYVCVAERLTSWNKVSRPFAFDRVKIGDVVSYELD